MVDTATSMKDRYTKCMSSIEAIKRSVIEKETQKKSLEEDIDAIVQKMDTLGVKPETIEKEYGELSARINKKLDELESDIGKVSDKIRQEDRGF